MSALPRPIGQHSSEARELIGPLPRDRGWPLEDMLSLSRLDGFGRRVRRGWISRRIPAHSIRSSSTSADGRPIVIESADPPGDAIGLECVGKHRYQPRRRSTRRTPGASSVRTRPSTARPGGHADELLRLPHRRPVSLKASPDGYPHSLGFTGPSATVEHRMCLVADRAAPGRMGSRAVASATGRLAGGVCVMGSPAIIYDFAKHNELVHRRTLPRLRRRRQRHAVGERRRIRRGRAPNRGRGGSVTGSSVAFWAATTTTTARAKPILTPRPEAQEKLFRRVIDTAGIDAADVGMIEGHGTATRAGDRAELTALLNTYGAAGSAAFVGSAKSNLGHAQAAGGMLGVIKVLLAGWHGHVPSVVVHGKPHHRGGLGVIESASGHQVASVGSRRTGTGTARSRRTVRTGSTRTPSSACRSDRSTTISEHRLPDGTVPVLLSADTPSLLRAEAGALLTYLREHPTVPPERVADMLFRTRAARRYRALSMVTDSAGLGSALRAVVDGHEHNAVVRGDKAAGAHRLAYVLPGQGGQRPGMGALFYGSVPSFRAEVDRCHELFGELFGESPLAYLLGTGDAGRRHHGCAVGALHADGCPRGDVALGRHRRRCRGRPQSRRDCRCLPVGKDDSRGRGADRRHSGARRREHLLGRLCDGGGRRRPRRMRERAGSPARLGAGVGDQFATPGGHLRGSCHRRGDGGCVGRGRAVHPAHPGSLSGTYQHGQSVSRRDRSRGAKPGAQSALPRQRHRLHRIDSG